MSDTEVRYDRLEKAAFDAGAAGERLACAELVRASGCNCIPCHPDSAVGTTRVTVGGDSHRASCPIALAAAIEARP